MQIKTNPLPTNKQTKTKKNKKKKKREKKGKKNIFPEYM